MSRPADFADADFEATTGGPIRGPRLGALEWVRWAWRQLTSMRTALLLLLALAVAAVPGSLIPQQGADPNGVTAWKASNPGWVDVANALQLFSVYTSVWFSAVYLLLFISLIGCVIPRITHHLAALRAAPPRTPARLERLATHRLETVGGSQEAALASAEALLRRRRYRVHRYGASVSAERGYLRETGNLVFHTALLGILVAVFVGGGFTFTGQRLLTVGETFSNTNNQYDSITTGRFVDSARLAPYSLKVDSFAVAYTAAGEAVDYTARVTTTIPGQRAEQHVIKVNDPLDIQGTSVFLLGNGWSPHVTVRDASGRQTFSGYVPFQPQDATLGPLGSIGVVKNSDLRPVGRGVALLGFFYPAPFQKPNGTYESYFPNLIDPLLTFNVYVGDLHPDVSQNVFQLNTNGLTEVAGPPVGADHPSHDAVKLTMGRTATLPDGLGTVSFDGARRYVSLDIHHDPSQGWVAVFVVFAVVGLIASLLIPRRRMWVKVHDEADGELRVEYAALARGDDPGLARAVTELAEEHRQALGGAAEVREPVGV